MKTVILARVPIAMMVLGISACSPTHDRKVAADSSVATSASSQQGNQARAGDAPSSTDQDNARAPVTSSEGRQVCATDQLAIKRIGGDAGMGSVYETYAFTNKGARACVLPETPGVTRVSQRHGELPPMRHLAANGQPLTLVPGKSAYLSLALNNLASDGSPYPAAKCQAVKLKSIDVLLDPKATPIRLKHAGYGCLSGIDKLDVRPFSDTEPLASSH